MSALAGTVEACNGLALRFAALNPADGKTGRALGEELADLLSSSRIPAAILAVEALPDGEREVGAWGFFSAVVAMTEGFVDICFRVDLEEPVNPELVASARRAASAIQKRLGLSDKDARRAVKLWRDQSGRVVREQAGSLAS